jgi:hypothetical protein
VTPSEVWVDGPVSCQAEVSDPEDDAVTVTYTWWNVSDDTEIGSGQEIQLSPADILPGDTLRCEVSAEDEDGKQATDSEEVPAICGYYDINSLANTNFNLRLFIRPYVTDEHKPGQEGEPWDWDGDVPDWVFNFATELLNILDWLSAIYPEPNLMAAAAGIDTFFELASLIDEYAPELLEGTVPPDPNLYAYMVDDEGYTHHPWPDLELEWDDTYEVSVSGSGIDMLQYVGFGLDLEDMDLYFDDSMGDWHDHGDMPLVLWWPTFHAGAYCTSRYYNPSSDPQVTVMSSLPSSILLMELEVY